MIQWYWYCAEHLNSVYCVHVNNFNLCDVFDLREFILIYIYYFIQFTRWHNFVSWCYISPQNESRDLIFCLLFHARSYVSWSVSNTVVVYIYIYIYIYLRVMKYIYLTKMGYQHRIITFLYIIYIISTDCEKKLTKCLEFMIKSYLR